MRIEIKVKLDRPTFLPRQQRELIQGMIYKALGRDKYLSDLLHDTGLNRDEKPLKYFCFSEPRGFIDAMSLRLCFPHEWSIWLSSVEPYFIFLVEEELCKNGLRLGESSLEGQVFCQREGSPRITNLVKIEMLSPLVMNRSLMNAEGRRQMQYLGPLDDDFGGLVSANFVTKYQGLYRQAPESPVDLWPDPSGSLRACKVSYKGERMNGWLGEFILAGRPDYLRLLYDCGLGAKNSQGCGLFKINACQE